MLGRGPVRLKRRKVSVSVNRCEYGITQSNDIERELLLNPKLQQKMPFVPLSASQQVSFKPQNYLQSVASKLDATSDGNSISALIINFSAVEQIVWLATVLQSSCLRTSCAHKICTLVALAAQHNTRLMQTQSLVHTEIRAQLPKCKIFNSPQDSE